MAARTAPMARGRVPTHRRVMSFLRLSVVDTRDRFPGGADAPPFLSFRVGLFRALSNIEGARMSLTTLIAWILLQSIQAGIASGRSCSKRWLPD